MLFLPPSPPLTHGPVNTADRLGDVLVTLSGVAVGVQNDPDADNIYVYVKLRTNLCNPVLRFSEDVMAKTKQEGRPLYFEDDRQNRLSANPTLWRLAHHISDILPMPQQLMAS